MTEQEARTALVATLAARASAQATMPLKEAFQRLAEGLRPLFDGLGVAFREMGRYIVRVAKQVGPTLLRAAFILRFQRESERLAHYALPAPAPEMLALHRGLLAKCEAQGLDYHPTLPYTLRESLSPSGFTYLLEQHARYLPKEPQ